MPKLILTAGAFRIIKRNVELESHGLFERLILCRTTADLADCIAGQPLPRVWTQGNALCVICGFDGEKLAAPFFDSRLNAAERCLHALKLEAELKAVFAADAARRYKSL